MICVECATPARSLYTHYSDDNITVTKCTNCGLFVDKYIECEPILVALDLLLLRPAAVRHVVFNAATENTVECVQSSATRSAATHGSATQGSATHSAVAETLVTRSTSMLAKSRDSSDQSARRGSTEGLKSSVSTLFFRKRWGIPVQVFRLIVLAVLFDVYQQWALCEKSQSPLVQHFIAMKSPAFQYSMFLALCTVDTFLMHFTVRRTASYLFGWKDGGAISTALLLGSFSKLLPILTFIWHYDMPFVTHIVRYAALFCVVEVLTIILGRGYIASLILTIAGLTISMIVNQAFWTIVRVLT